MRDRLSFERELSRLEVLVSPTAPPADTLDEDAAEPQFAQVVQDKVGSLLGANASKDAVKWNAANHPKVSGIDLTALVNALGRYVNRGAVERSMQNRTDEPAVIAEMAHQFQQKIYADTRRRDGKIGEGTLDALGFTRHQGKDLNRVDERNQRFHGGGDKSTAHKRLESVYRTEKPEFEKVAPDLSPATWYSFFVNAPFLGRPFGNGIHVQLMKRLRIAQRSLLAMPRYAPMSPVELGAALGIDEDHGGGRINSKTSSSMHTFGLAADIGYTKNPWVAGQEGSRGDDRNKAFRQVSVNVSRLVNGTDHEVNPGWLDSLGTNSSLSTAACYEALKKCHSDSLAYLSLEKDLAGLEAKIAEHKLQKPAETIAAAMKRWTGVIQADRKRLQYAYGSNRKPENGFLNLHRDLVIALRDKACLAWGAIDLGGSSGDMMHFDSRVRGIGRVVKPEKGHTVVYGHSCADTKSERETREYEEPPRPSSAVKPWVFALKTINVNVAVFVSTAARRSNGWELLVYAHGHNTCAPKQENMPLSFITDAPFKLGQVIEASGRPMTVAVPFFDWENLVANQMNIGKEKPQNQWHKIGQPRILNGVIDQILQEAGQKIGKAQYFVSLVRLIVAGHSGAYGFLDPLAHGHADPEMSQGALAKLTDVWGIETSYTGPGTYWPQWLASPNAPNVRMFYGGDSKTNAGGGQYKKLIAKSNGKLFAVQLANVGHCAAPNLLLPYLLSCRC